jgi:hypothetical protein
MSESPVSESPVSELPVSELPVSDPPVSELPVSDPPVFSPRFFPVALRQAQFYGYEGTYGSAQVPSAAPPRHPRRHLGRQLEKPSTGTLGACDV